MHHLSSIPLGHDALRIFYHQLRHLESFNKGNNIARYTGSLVSAGTGSVWNKLANSLSQDRFNQDTISPGM